MEEEAALTWVFRVMSLEGDIPAETRGGGGSTEEDHAGQLCEEEEALCRRSTQGEGPERGVSGRGEQLG